MRKRIALLASNLLNPFPICFVCIILISLKYTDSFSAALKWVVIALALTVLPVFLFIVYQVRRKKLDSLFPEKREQRKKIYALASILAAVGCAIMWCCGAPQMLTVSFIAGLAATVVFTLINLYWKISLHTAFVSSGATVLTMAYGVNAAWLFLLLPLVAWSRLELKMHTPWQVIAGAALSAGIITGVSWGFGMII